MLMWRATITFTVVLFIPVLAYSDTIIVPDDYPTIQGAIDAAVNGDTVLVKPGTYVEQIWFNGKAITLTSEQGASVTTIDGNGHIVVRFLHGEGLDSVLDGFTITNGSPGICCGSPTIKNNVISGNHGCGISCGGGSPIITNNVISENTHYYVCGGGIYCGECSAPIITDNIILNNRATYSPFGSGCGGGIFCDDDSAPIITNNVISGNSVGWSGWNGDGGGICCYKSSPTITNNTISLNTASNGGGIFCNDSSPVLANTILWSNDATLSGLEIGIGSTSTLTISYSDIKGGQSSCYVETGSTLNWGPGNIASDPLFVDPANGDYHLTFLSPCRGSGDNSVVTESYDFEGDPRICQGTVDIGADECYRHLYCMGDFTPGGSIEGKFIGLPGTTPVGLFVGSAVHPSPIPTMWGEFWLQAPWFLFGPLGAIPADGVMVFPTILPGSIPAPYDVPMQALIGLNADSLSNLFVLQVR